MRLHSYTRRVVATAVIAAAAIGGTSVPLQAIDVDSLYESMSVDERLAQLLLVAWDGEEPSDLVLEWIRKRGLGGVKVFGWNSEDSMTLARSIGAMQQAALSRNAEARFTETDAGELSFAESSSGVPLFVATDQEGGWVRHVRGDTSRSAGNMAIGATGVPSDAYNTGRYIGAELRALGINLNFAPTVDVYRNPDADVIGSRAFGDDPGKVGLFGLGFFRGHERERVVSTAKHFPGHGNAAGDSHGILPQLSATFEELHDFDLLPYRMLINEGVPAVLSAHVAAPEITDEPIPASLSEQILQRVLRDELGFEGIVISDDMHMRGATLYADKRGWSFGELQVKAIEAGNDMIVLSRTPRLDGETWSALREAYDTSESFRTRVEESVKRILNVKGEYLGNEQRVPFVPDISRLETTFPNEKARAFFADHARRAVSIVHNGSLPVEPSNYDRVLLAGNVANFFPEGRRIFPDAQELQFSYTPHASSRPEDLRAVRRAAESADLIVFALSNRNSLEILKSLEPHASSLVVISTLSPLLLSEVDFVERAIAVYGLGRESFEAGFDVLSGEARAEGTVPLRVFNDHSEGTAR